MPRKKSGTFNQQEYDKAYHREHTTYRKLSINDGNQEDQIIAAWIDAQPESTSAYLKRLVLEDMIRRQPTKGGETNEESLL